MSEFLETLRNLIDEYKTDDTCSAWVRGVGEYASDFCDRLYCARGYWNIELLDESELDRFLLDGASDWSEYSWGGNSLICDSDIAERLCCPSWLESTDHGRLQPNEREHWLDVQARALFVASIVFKYLYRQAQEETD